MSPPLLSPVFASASPVATTVHWIMGGSVVAFVLVEAAVAWQAFRRRPDAPGPLKSFSRRRVEAAWMLTPALILVSLLLWTSNVLGRDVRNVPSDPDLTVRVTAHQYYWQLRYEIPGADGKTREVEVAPNQLHLPEGKVARIELSSADVVHGFWVPQFSIKETAIPGSTHEIWMKPGETGAFNIVCAELCGNSHYAMRGFVHVESPEAFEKWLASADLGTSTPDAVSTPGGPSAAGPGAEAAK